MSEGRGHLGSPVPWAHLGTRKENRASGPADPYGQGLPHTMQVGEVEGRQQLTEGSVTDPAEEGQGPPEAGEEAQLKYTHIVTPAWDPDAVSPDFCPPP